MEEEIPIPDPPMTVEEEAMVAQLTAIEHQEIDRTLLSNATKHWRKVGMVVGMTMEQLSMSSVRATGIPDLFYCARVRKLVDEGRLQSQGNLFFMRFSEVRLPQ